MLTAVNNNLVTIIIPCFNTVKYTRFCVDSILAYTTTPYELILIDNGSADGTARYFQQLKKTIVVANENNLKRFEVILSKTNLGVAAALNRGIRISRGRYICYLNNDVIVTKGWLEGLIRCAKSDKKIGVAGCSSNPGTNERLFFTGCPMYKSMEDIQRTAIAVSMVRKDVYIDVELVHGLCMFIKRELINKIGLFDERFYPCGREDIDYVVRAKRAGYRAVDAMDVYVFHFYNKSTTSKSFKKYYGHIDGITETAINKLRTKMGKAPVVMSRGR